MVKRAIVWAAVSTAPQADENEKQSITTQKADGLAFAERNGFDVVDVLIVPGHSRDYFTMADCADAMRSQGISAFDDLLRHIKRRDFDVFICRDADRFGRKMSLVGEVIGRIVDTGAVIYTLNGVCYDASNYVEFTALSGLRAELDVRRIRQYHKAGMDKLAERGLTSRVPYSHKVIRNEAGRQVAMIVDESKRRLFDDLATLLLEGVGYSRLEHEMYTRFGHVRTNGKRFQKLFFYTLLMNPVFWGHIARHHRGKGSATRDRNYASYGAWILEPGHDITQGVDIWYNVAPAVYTGEQAERMKAEVMRRFEDGSRAYSNLRRTWHQGLFICGECGYTMSVANQHGRHTYIRCYTHYDRSPTRGDCTQTRHMRIGVAQEYVDVFLRKLHEGADPSAFENNGHGADNGKRQRQLETEITQLRGQLSRLILKQTETDDELVKPFYDQEIRAAGERLNILTSELERVERQAVQTDRERSMRQHAIDKIRGFEVSDLWKLPPVQLNRMLRDIMQDWRFVVYDKEVTGMAKKWR